jgi:hypothetical protein
MKRAKCTSMNSLAWKLSLGAISLYGLACSSGVPVRSEAGPDASPEASARPDASGEASSDVGAPCTLPFAVSAAKTVTTGPGFAIGGVAGSPAGFGLGWLASTKTESTPYFVALDSTGNRLFDPIQLARPTVIGSPVAPSEPAVVPSGSSYGVAWSGPPGVYLTLVDSAGKASTPSLLLETGGQDAYGSLQIAASSKAYLVAGYDSLGLGGWVTAQLADVQGKTLWNPGAAFYAYDVLDATSAPSNIVFDGTSFAFAWINTTTLAVEIAFVREDGTSAQAGPGAPLSGIVVHPGRAAVNQSPLLAWTGSELIVWWFTASDDAGVVPDGVSMLRLDALGKPTGPAQTFAMASTNPSLSALAWTGSELGAIATKNPESQDAAAMAYALLRYSPTGGSLGRLELSEGIPGSTPTLAWAGTEYALAWVDSAGGLRDGRIAFARAGQCP